MYLQKYNEDDQSYHVRESKTATYVEYVKLMNDPFILKDWDIYWPNSLAKFLGEVLILS